MKITKVGLFKYAEAFEKPAFEVFLVPSWWEFWKSKTVEYYSPMFKSYYLRLYPTYSFGKKASKQIEKAIKNIHNEN
jgi:hypothetical protein